MGLYRFLYFRPFQNINDVTVSQKLCTNLPASLLRADFVVNVLGVEAEALCKQWEQKVVEFEFPII